jgi:hypothetical protein
MHNRVMFAIHRITAAAILIALPFCARAAEAPRACDDSAYVPGVDVDGHRVAPADITPPVTVEADPLVVARQKLPGNRQTPEAFVGVFVQGLDRALNPPRCAPPPAPTPRPNPRAR